MASRAGARRVPAPSCSSLENKHFLEVKYEVCGGRPAILFLW
jgi:hypothetical protein